VGSTLFSDHFKGGFIAQFRGLGFSEPGPGDATDPGEIRAMDGDAAHGIGSEDQRPLGVAIEDSGAFEALLQLEGAQGGGGLGSGDAIDGSGVDAMGGEGDLGFENGGGLTRGPGNRGVIASRNRIGWNGLRDCGWGDGRNPLQGLGGDLNRRGDRGVGRGIDGRRRQWG